MTKYAAVPTNAERTFGEEEIIVSKTNLKGHITYANDVFLSVGQYTEDELLGQPHSILRHPDMPRSVFKLLWDKIQDKKEIFAYVKNMAKSGDFYWVFAHVTPSYDNAGEITGFHSNRRCPRPDAIAKIAPIYELVLGHEQKQSDPKSGLAAGCETIAAFLEDQCMSYDEFVFSL